MEKQESIHSRFVYWKREEAKSPWKLIPATKEHLQKAVNEGAMFTTWTEFSHEPGNGLGEPIRYGNLPLDFDCKSNPEVALNDMRALCLQHFPEQYGIDPHAIRFYISGSKGYHAIIPEWLFGHPEGHNKLPLIYKRILERITETLPLTTLDMSLFCMGKGKMFRLPNVQRSNGRFKAPISLQEVMLSDAASLEKLSMQRRRIDRVDLDIMPNQELKALWEEAAREVEDLDSAMSEPLTQAQLAQISETPPSCILYILKNLPPKTLSFNFNRAVMFLVNYFQDTGASLDRALDVSHEFLRGYAFSDTYNTVEARLEHFKKQWQYMFKQFGYSFSCERAHGLKLPKDAYDCLHCISPTVSTVDEGPAQDREEQKENQIDFPFEVMLGHAGFFSHAFGSVMEAPEHFLFMGFLTCLGAYYAPLVRINSELHTSPRLYTVLMGGSADERKSTAIKKCVQTFRAAYPGFRISEGMNSAEGLQRVLTEGSDDPFQHHGVVLMVFDEFKSFVSKCSLDSSTLLPLVNSLFENTSCESNTKDKTIRIESGYVSMLCATTIDTYQRIYTPSFIHIGFPNRIFLIPGHAGRRFSIPRPLDSADRKQIHSGLLEIRNFVRQELVYDYTPGALEVYNAWYFGIKSSVHAKRLDTYSLRLMQLLALNQEKPIIDEEIVTHAIALCDWQLKVRQLFDPIDADSAIAQLEQRILRALGNGPLRDRDLKTKVNAYRSGLWMYDRALENLKKHSDISWDTKTKRWGLIS